MAVEDLLYKHPTRDRDIVVHEPITLLGNKCDLSLMTTKADLTKDIDFERIIRPHSRICGLLPYICSVVCLSVFGLSLSVGRDREPCKIG